MTKLIIYSCITGGYDKPKEHTYKHPDADYVMFTGLNDLPWADGVPKKHPKRVNLLAKYPKVLPHLIDGFNEYDYSLWIDGNIDILTPMLYDRVEELMRLDRLYAVSGHFSRDCAYREIDAARQYGLDTVENLYNIASFLDKEGYPAHYGLCENNIILRKHEDERVQNLMHEWWNMIAKYSHRDQLSFNYCCWKDHFSPDQLFPDNRSYPQDIIVNKHGGKR